MSEVPADADIIEAQKPEFKFPRSWKHKENGKICRVMPWWEIPYDQEMISERAKIVDPKIKDNRMMKIGVLVQIGFLLENKGGVWFGVNLSVQDYFEDLGPCEEKK